MPFSIGREAMPASRNGAFRRTSGWPASAALRMVLAALLLLAAAAVEAANQAAIQLENRSGENVLVRLVGPTAAVVAVPQGERRTVAVAPGSYQVLVRYGAEPSRFTYGRAESVTVSDSGASPMTVTLRPPGSGAATGTPPSPPAAALPPPPPVAVQPRPAEPPRAEPPRAEPPRAEPPRAAGGGFVLSGNIVNLAAARRHIDSRSYLQLVSLPPDRRLTYTSDNEGRVTYLSELARTEIAADGHFRLAVPPLQPGDYVIVAQGVKSYGAEENPVPALAETYTRKTQVITVPAGRTAPLVQHLGPLYIPTPVQRP